jgi:regulatory protein NPR1
MLQRRLSDIVGIAFYEDIIPIIRVASKCHLSHLLNQCIQRVAFSTLDDNFLEKELAGDIYNDIKKFRRELDASIVDAEHEKRVTGIHKALDSGNVDHVSMLLKQYGVTLDESLAIHYAATYCEPKVLRELLKLDHANVNVKNSGGYTPLHMACMRLEPDIIVALLDKGASVQEQTRDQRDALTICKRLTRHQKDVNRELKKGQEISKPYLCILPILEEIKRTDQVSLEEAIARFTPLRVDNFFMRLLDLECRG